MQELTDMVVSYKGPGLHKRVSDSQQSSDACGTTSPWNCWIHWSGEATSEHLATFLAYVTRNNLKSSPGPTQAVSHVLSNHSEVLLSSIFTVTLNVICP